ncbi:MAG: YgiT-type zinc finger protein [Ignavibacteria bacterium]
MENAVCEVCKTGRRENKFIIETFNIDGRYVIIENVPVEICSYCGEETFSVETTGQLRKMPDGKVNESQHIEAELFHYKKVS